MTALEGTCPNFVYSMLLGRIACRCKLPVHDEATPCECAYDGCGGSWFSDGSGDIKSVVRFPREDFYSSEAALAVWVAAMRALGSYREE